MDSLYKQHPVGSLLLWATRTEEAAYRGDNAPTFGTVKLILDGQLLAAAANEFMGRLYAGTADQEPLTLSVHDTDSMSLGGVANEEEEELLFEINSWAVALGLFSGEILYDLTDEDTGEEIAVLGLAWHEGLQEGLTRPVALMVDEAVQLVERVNQRGFLVITDENAFKQYVAKVLSVQLSAAV
tara:strand:+ start:2346 stop:2897 length:552 start_codon:yes stop_codon:yes gene_type:complete